MSKNSSIAHIRTYTFKGIIPGVIIGEFIGILAGFLHRTEILIIPVLSTVFSTIPLNEIITGTLLGIIIGGIMGGVLGLYSNKKISVEYLPKISKNVTFQIKKEQLDIAKKWVQTGEVKVYRDTFTEEKNFIVPVKREELVIEKKALDSTTSIHKDPPTEIIRIPLSEEQVEFNKHRVALEDISIYKQQIEDVKHIEKKLKREVTKVKASGTPKVRDESNSNHS